MRIVSVGECAHDRYLDLGIAFAGGISLNFAVNSLRCGADYVAMVSCVGDDAGGRAALRKLQHEGIDASHVYVHNGPTAHQDIYILARGERLFPPGGYDAGVVGALRLSDEDRAFVRSFDIMALAKFGQVEGLFRQAINDPAYTGKRVVDFTDSTDYVKLTEHLDMVDISFISGDAGAVEALLPFSRGCRGVIVVTHGAEGSTALVQGEPVYQPVVPVAEPRDSTGCGDAFQAAFTVSYFRDGDIRQALERGAHQAARVLQHYGSTDDEEPDVF